MKPEILNDYIFQKYSSGDKGTWNQTSVNMIAFIKGLQWEVSRARALEAANQPALVDNEVTPAIDLLIANLTENEPRFQSGGREESDAQSAADTSDLLSYIWDVSEGNERTELSIRDFEHTGLGAYLAYVNPMEIMAKERLSLHL